MLFARPAAVLLSLLVAAPAAAQFASDHDRREAIRHYRSGMELMASERFQQAADEFQQAIALDRLLTLAHYGLGQSFMELRRFASAIKAFGDCRAAFFTLHGLRERDRFAVERQRDDELRELRDTVRRLSTVPNGEQIYRMTISKIESRIRDLDRQRKSNDGGFVSPPEVSLSLGSAYFRNGQLEDAEREWLAAADANSRLGEAHNNLAALYAMKGRKKEAEQAVKSAEKAGFRVNPGLKDDIKRLPTS